MVHLVLAAVLFAGCCWVTDGLQCIQCVDPRDGGRCKDDYKGIVNATLGESHEFYNKTCVHDPANNFTQPYCVIEEFFEGEDLKSFLRDCSDGKTFSFTESNVDGSNSNRYPKLKQIRPDNYTTCVYSTASRGHICLTLCEGDFCNAPRPNITEELDCSVNGTDNETCGAQSLFFASGPFGPTVDAVLGRGYFVPLVLSLISVLFLG